jgi:hypothetical protein
MYTVDVQRLIPWHKTAKYPLRDIMNPFLPYLNGFIFIIIQTSRAKTGDKKNLGRVQEKYIS